MDESPRNVMMRPHASSGCRFCGATLRYSFVDLGMSPFCNTQIEYERLNFIPCMLGFVMVAFWCSSKNMSRQKIFSVSTHISRPSLIPGWNMLVVTLR